MLDIMHASTTQNRIKSMTRAMKPSGHLFFYLPIIKDILDNGDSNQRTADICFRINYRLSEKQKPYFSLKTEKCRRILMGLTEAGELKKVKGFNKNEHYWELAK